MPLTPAVISLVSKTQTQTVIRIDSYDAEADSFDMWRSEGAGSDPTDEEEPTRVKVGDNIDPDQDFTDNHEFGIGTILKYALHSLPDDEEPEYSAETIAYIEHVEDDDGEVQDKDAINALFEFLVDNSLLSAVRYGIAPYGGMKLRDDNGDLFATKAYNFNLDEEYDPEQATAAGQYELVNGIWRCDTASVRLFPVHEVKPQSWYFRFWHKLDYSLSTSNPNQELCGSVDDSNDGLRWRYDSDRPRSESLEFTDGEYGVRGGIMAAGGWWLHEIMYDYSTALYRWVVSQSSFASRLVQSSQRTSGTTVTWGSGTGIRNFTPRGTANVNTPTELGSFFILDTVPSDQVREDWYDLDKAKYGYGD